MSCQTYQFGEMTSSTDSPLVDNFTVDNHLRMFSLSGASSPVQVLILFI